VCALRAPGRAASERPHVRRLCRHADRGVFWRLCFRAGRASQSRRDVMHGEWAAGGGGGGVGAGDENAS